MPFELETRKICFLLMIPWSMLCTLVPHVGWGGKRWAKRESFTFPTWTTCGNFSSEYFLICVAVLCTLLLTKQAYSIQCWRHECIWIESNPVPRKSAYISSGIFCSATCMARSPTCLNLGHLTKILCEQI